MIQAGDRVGQYEIVRRIGSGGMATVYLALHPRLDRQVALKVMHDAFQQDTEYLARFEREARIVAGLEHPHIIPVFDYSEHEGKPYLVMKYVEGRSLKSMLDADKHLASITEILDLLGPVADALDYAHSKGILHRDVKPSNIILDAFDTPYLADFGLARIAMAGESTLSQDVILGTPQYISPEQARGKVNIDGRTDLYSLGIVLYQLIVGDVPFSADTPFAVIHDHIYSPVPDPQLINPDITPDVAAVLDRALAKNPQDRYPSAKAMLDDLKAAAQRGGLDAINAEHVSRASTTLALLREQADDGAFSTPYTPRRIESPVTKTVVDNSSLITEYRYRHGWIWTVGGVVTFILSFIAIGVVDSRIDGQSLSSRVQMSEDIVNARINTLETQLPDLSLIEARRVVADAPEEPLPYVAAARTFWTRGRTAIAMQTVEAGRNHTEDAVEYALLVASIAHDLGDPWSAVGLYIQSTVAAEAADTQTFEVVRSLAGAAVFDLAVSITASAEADVQRYVEQLPPDAPDMAYIALVAAWLELENTDQAAALLDILDERDTRYEAEYEFLQGDYAWYIGDIEQAREQWQEAIDRDYVPAWIFDEVQERLEETKNENQS